MGEMRDQGGGGGGGAPFFICQVNHYYKTLPAMLEKSNISVFLFMPPSE